MATTHLKTPDSYYVIGTHNTDTATTSIAALGSRRVPNPDDGEAVLITRDWRQRVTDFGTNTHIEVIRDGIPALRFST